MKTRRSKEINRAMFSHRLFGKMEWTLLMGILFLLLLSLFIRSAWATEPQRLQRDLGVMEDVLESLCAHAGDQQAHWGSGPQARGLYLKGYGLLFLVEGCLPSSSPENVLVSVVRKGGGEKIVETKGGRHVVKVVKKGDPSGGTAEEAPTDTKPEDPREKARELIGEFLGNYADITNLSNGSTDAGANITQTSLFSGGLNFFSGLVSASNSSVASQYNIAALVALEGSVLNSSIINSNIAEVFNLGNAALVAQNNIAIAIARNGIIDNVTISNTNEATVINNVNGVDGGAQVGSFVLNKGNLNITINAESVTNSIGIIQNNITILSVIGSSLNSLSGVNIENINISNIINNL